MLGRFFDHRLHDMLELGVDRYKGIKEFAKAATAVQIGNKVNHFLQLHTRVTQVVWRAGKQLLGVCILDVLGLLATA